MDKVCLENQLLYDTFLENYYFKSFQKHDQYTGIELIVSGNCNQKCEYCYLYKHQQELYPSEIDKKELILNNLVKFFNWLEQYPDWKIPLHIFSGEFFNLPYWEQVLQIIHKYVTTHNNVTDILIPSNCSFCIDKAKIELVQRYLDNFQNTHCRLAISCSIDGQILDNVSRKSKDEKDKTNQFYLNLGEFAKKNEFYFHPMLSDKNVFYWKENFDWWIDYLDKYNRPDEALYILEVRDGSWNKESRKALYDFIQYVGDATLSKKKECYYFDPHFYSYNILTFGGYKDVGISCSLQSLLHIRLGDLKVVPCHRLMYNDLSLGKLVNGKFIEENVSLSLLLNSYNKLNAPQCSACPINRICLGGCLGAQHESTGDMFAPDLNVCKMEFTKAKALITIYDKYNFLTEKHMLDRAHKDQIDFIRSIDINELF